MTVAATDRTAPKLLAHLTSQRAAGLGLGVAIVGAVVDGAVAAVVDAPHGAPVRRWG
jgi:hypothetical protein